MADAIALDVLEILNDRSGDSDRRCSEIGSRFTNHESRASVVLPGCARPPRWGPGFLFASSCFTFSNLGSFVGCVKHTNSRRGGSGRRRGCM